MRAMEKVIRYRCKWCGREFRTPDRHCCRFDPDAKNCLSCAYVGKFDEGEPSRGHPSMPGYDEGVAPSFECACGHGGGGGWNSFPEAVSRPDSERTDYHCPDHKLMDGYVGSRSFADRMYEFK